MIQISVGSVPRGNSCDLCQVFVIVVVVAVVDNVEVLPYVRRNRRFIRDGTPGRPPRLSHSSCALNPTQLKCCFTSTETVGLLGTGT